MNAGCPSEKKSQKIPAIETLSTREAQYQRRLRKTQVVKLRSWPGCCCPGSGARALAAASLWSPEPGLDGFLGDLQSLRLSWRASVRVASQARASWVARTALFWRGLGSLGRSCSRFQSPRGEEGDVQTGSLKFSDASLVYLRTRHTSFVCTAVQLTRRARGRGRNFFRDVCEQPRRRWTLDLVLFTKVSLLLARLDGCSGLHATVQEMKRRNRYTTAWMSIIYCKHVASLLLGRLPFWGLHRNSCFWVVRRRTCAAAFIS